MLGLGPHDPTPAEIGEMGAMGETADEAVVVAHERAVDAAPSIMSRRRWSIIFAISAA